MLRVYNKRTKINFVLASANIRRCKFGGGCSMRSRWSPWCSFRPWSWLMRSRCAPGICPPGRALSCAPWSLALVYGWCAPGCALARSSLVVVWCFQVVAWCLLVPGLWLMLPGGRPGARSVPGLWLMSPGCALARSFLVVVWCFQVVAWCLLVPGLWLMLPGGRPGRCELCAKK